MKFLIISLIFILFGCSTMQKHSENRHRKIVKSDWIQKTISQTSRMGDCQ